MLYDRSRASVYKGQNPLKLYEYLAAGLSVLSTPHDEYEYVNPPVIIVENTEDIAPAVTKTVQEKESLSFIGVQIMLLFIIASSTTNKLFFRLIRPLEAL